MPSRNGEVRIEVYVGAIANHFLTVISDAVEDGKSQEFSKLDSLANHFFDNLERGLKKDWAGLNYFDRGLAQSEIEAAKKAAEMCQFPLDLENIARLKKICRQAAKNNKITPDDYLFLKHFLECIQRYSYEIAPRLT